ncbi:MAG: aminotransferase class V-fold PLP-dependent enzyme [Bacteroidota bacterium]|nr:aminotransferase class V-fold PLP-dependent enzyme [Bacteroidota bacterium]
MKHHVNFTPGPSQLYFTVSDHAREAFKAGIPSLSHRSRKFEEISKEATDGLRQLLKVPENFHIFFTSSATEIWERVFQNLVEESSFHLVNGSFSKRFHEIGIQLHKKAEKFEVAAGQGFASDLSLPDAAELIAVTHNETSTGVSIPLEDIYRIRAKAPSALIAVDAVSSLPHPDFDFNMIDSLFFSVQKGFGLPAGLGVWMVNEKCVAKSETIATKGISTGSYHNISTLLAHAKKNQTPETPNVLGIYLLGKVVADFLRRGIDNIRKETDYKAAVLYQALENNPHAKAFVTEKAFRSKTVIVADCGNNTEKLAAFLATKGLYAGSGYGSAKKTQLRFANFPAHSKEQYELLADALREFKIQG